MKTDSNWRVAVFIGDNGLSRWQQTCIRELASRCGASCAVVGSKVPLDKSRGLSARKFAWWYPSLLDSTAIDESLLWLEGSNKIDIQDAIREFQPDLILNLCEGGLDPSFMTSAAQEAWYFRMEGRVGLPSRLMSWFARLGNRRTVAIEMVGIGGQYGKGQVLQRGCFRIKPHCKGSSIDQMLSMLEDWPAASYLRIQNSIQVSEVDEEGSAVPNDAGSTGLGAFLGMLSCWVMRAVCRPFEYEQWGIGVVKKTLPQLVLENGEDASFGDVQWIEPQGNPPFIADPFALERDNSLYVFHERLDPGSSQGVIAYSRVDKNGTGPSHEIISRDAHLSYPFLLEHDGKTYCIPESAEAREVAIYEVKEFPDAWEKVGVLLSDLVLYDPTIIEHDGRWWMFGSGPEEGGQLTLNVWYADQLLGPWSPHPGNPVRTDISGARPAGTPFFHKGSWYRPAQDCSQTYGGAVVVHRIEELSTTCYRESFVRRLSPDPGWPFAQGFHTVSAVGSMTVIDAKRLSLSIRAFPRFFRQKILRCKS